MSAFLGADWGVLVVMGVFVLIILATSWGYYTRTGSGIDEHPVDDRARSPGAKGPATVSGAGRTPESKSRRQSVVSRRRQTM
jgi:hypothetical protein